MHQVYFTDLDLDAAFDEVAFGGGFGKALIISSLSLLLQVC